MLERCRHGKRQVDAVRLPLLKFKRPQPRACNKTALVKRAATATLACGDLLMYASMLLLGEYLTWSWLRTACLSDDKYTQKRAIDCADTKAREKCPAGSQRRGMHCTAPLPSNSRSLGTLGVKSVIRLFASRVATTGPSRLVRAKKGCDGDKVFISERSCCLSSVLNQCSIVTTACARTLFKLVSVSTNFTAAFMKSTNPSALYCSVGTRSCNTTKAQVRMRYWMVTDS